MNASDYAAWYAAVVSTIGASWEIFRQLRSGARLRIDAIPNMIPRNVHPEIDGRRYVSVTVTNIGDQPTTITHFGGILVPHCWEGARGVEGNGFLVWAHPRTGSTVPYVLKPGEQWNSLADQAELETNTDRFNVFIGVRASHSNKLHSVRVDLPRRTSRT